MKKTSALAELERIKLLAEQQEMSDENSRLTSLAIIQVLLEYGNDPQIRAATEAIPF